MESRRVCVNLKPRQNCMCSNSRPPPRGATPRAALLPLLLAPAPAGDRSEGEGTDARGVTGACADSTGSCWVSLAGAIALARSARVMSSDSEADPGTWVAGATGAREGLESATRVASAPAPGSLSQEDVEEDFESELLVEDA
eukprot:586232-Alexandrium_andersonii.AAC.1